SDFVSRVFRRGRRLWRRRQPSDRLDCPGGEADSTEQGRSGGGSQTPCVQGHPSPIGIEEKRMKAIAVIPGKPNSVHLAEMPKPSLDQVPGGRGVLVRVLRVGVDGTDREINAAEYGAAPKGYDFLVLGHESFGRVEAVGQNVT